MAFSFRAEKKTILITILLNNDKEVVDLKQKLDFESVVLY